MKFFEKNTFLEVCIYIYIFVIEDIEVDELFREEKRGTWFVGIFFVYLFDY